MTQSCASCWSRRREKPMSTKAPMVRTRRMTPPPCDWCGEPAEFVVDSPDLTSRDLVCAEHRRAAASAMRAFVRIERARLARIAQAEAARVAAQRQQQEDERRALRERIAAAVDAGAEYPIMLPPGVPDDARAVILAQIAERG